MNEPGRPRPNQIWSLWDIKQGTQPGLLGPVKEALIPSAHSSAGDSLAESSSLRLQEVICRVYRGRKNPQIRMCVLEFLGKDETESPSGLKTNQKTTLPLLWLRETINIKQQSTRTYVPKATAPASFLLNPQHPDQCQHTTGTFVSIFLITYFFINCLLLRGKHVLYKDHSFFKSALYSQDSYHYLRGELRCPTSKGGQGKALNPGCQTPVWAPRLWAARPPAKPNSNNDTVNQHHVPNGEPLWSQ